MSGPAEMSCTVQWSHAFVITRVYGSHDNPGKGTLTLKLRGLAIGLLRVLEQNRESLSAFTDARPVKRRSSKAVPMHIKKEQTSRVVDSVSIIYLCPMPHAVNFL